MSFRTVHKFDLDTDDGHTHVQAQPGAKPVLFGFQHGFPCVWMEIPDSTEFESDRYYFCLVGTGHDVPPDAEHFQSCQYGDFVWHLYLES